MYSQFLNFATNIAQVVAQIQLSYFRGGDLNIVAKSNIYDVVTRADKESEQYIVSKILETFPDHKIIGEQGGDYGYEPSDYLWVIAPLDGTTNYSLGLPVFAISIGLQYKGETIMGLVYAPYLRELYYAIKGSGAFIKTGDNEAVAINVFQKQSVASSVVATYDNALNPDSNSANATAILPHVQDSKRMGSAAYDLCAVAAGMLDVYWEMSLNLWNVCAGNLIVQEAGGMVCFYRDDRNMSVVAANNTIVEQLKQDIA